MNQNIQKRSLKRRLQSDVINWLRQLYSVNPYPDRFQYGTMALHCKIDAARVQTWFTNRRASDWRRGNLCRTCRYFKSPLATEELHRLQPNSRHCVLLSMPQYLQNFANEIRATVTHPTPSSTTTEANIVNNEKFFPVQGLFYNQPLGHQPHNYRQQFLHSQATMSWQKQEQQFGGMMPHQLPFSSPMVYNSVLICEHEVTDCISVDVDEFRRQNLHQTGESRKLMITNSAQAYATSENGCSTDSFCDRKYSPPKYWSSSQGSEIVSHNLTSNAASSATKLEENESVQESPLLNVDMPSDDYAQIIYPDYMDFPQFPLPTNNVNLKPF